MCATRHLSPPSRRLFSIAFTLSSPFSTPLFSLFDFRFDFHLCFADAATLLRDASQRQRYAMAPALRQATLSDMPARCQRDGCYLLPIRPPPPPPTPLEPARRLSVPLVIHRIGRSTAGSASSAYTAPLHAFHHSTPAHPALNE